MKTSESLTELLPALVKAQAMIESAKKDSTNPHFRSRYADLASVWDAVKAPLNTNGLALTQCIDESCANPILATTLWHVSGQHITSEVRVRAMKEDAQGFGAGLTYARRQALSALLSVASEDDDDGNAASGVGSGYRAAPSTNIPKSLKIATVGKFKGRDLMTVPIHELVSQYNAAAEAKDKRASDLPEWVDTLLAETLDVLNAAGMTGKLYKSEAKS